MTRAYYQVLDQIETAQALIGSFPDHLPDQSFRQLYQCSQLHSALQTVLKKCLSLFPPLIESVADIQHADLLAAYNLLIMADEIASDHLVTPEDDASSLSSSQVALIRTGSLLRASALLLRPLDRSST